MIDLSGNYRLLVSVQTPMYSTRAFWKERPIGQVYRKGRNVTSQGNITDVILQNDIAGPSDVVCSRHQWSMTTRLILTELY